MHFERRNAFPEKKKKLCLPYLKISDPLSETHLFFFIWPKHQVTLNLVLLSAYNHANGLDQDRGRQNLRPDLDPICLTQMVFLKEFLILKKKSADDKKNHEKFPRGQRVKHACSAIQ